MLRTIFLNKEFLNPIVVASGVIGVTGASLNRAIINGCGGVTAKSISLTPRFGHPNPTMIGQEHFFLNAVGLSNPGVEEAVKELIEFRRLSSAPLIGSIFAGTPDEFAAVAEILCQAPLDYLEIDISCPNVSKEFGEPFAYTTSAVELITKKVKAVVNVPISVKLSPNAWNIDQIAQAAEAAGADAITAVNTVSGMAIDLHSRIPILSNKQGGVSGPALFPLALKCVYDIYKKVKIPIIGTGGIMTGKDALEMIVAGATLLGVGSAIYFRGEDVFKKITQEMEEIMKTENIKNLDEIRGCAQ